MSGSDQTWMRWALELAMRGRGAVEPNPMVGCIVVKDGRIIGRGYHRAFGQAHAEPAALAACDTSPRGATAYVTMEPCCHAGKKTPPCVPALASAQVARVVVGCADPNPQVAGQGIAQLRQAGVEVGDFVLQAPCRQLNAAYFARMEQGRPYVTLKWAQTADGRIAAAGGGRLQITQPASQRIVHQLRARCEAILVGIGTVLNDDPSLTARTRGPSRSRLRIVIDRNLATPPASRLLATARDVPVLIYCSQRAVADNPAGAAALRNLGAELAIADEASGHLDLRWILADLGGRDVTHLLVEPGPSLAGAFLQRGLADRLWVFGSTMRVGDPSAPGAPAVEYPRTASLELDGDALWEHLNPQSAVYFAPEPSADFVLARSERQGA